MAQHAARHFVIGGTGFLGSHIVEGLKERPGVESITVFDLHCPSEEQRVEGVEYVSGDICDEANLVEVLKKYQPDIVHHTASPTHGSPPPIYYHVNEEGTRVVLAACQATGIKKVIYTSSTGVVWTGSDLKNVTEDQVPLPAQGYDAYHHTKGLGERLVTKANGVEGMQTVVLRPCGMIGERDRQLLRRLAEAMEGGQHTIQVGDNTNLVDYVYAGNVAHAHILAAEKLLTAPETVAGHVFFITNGSPMPQWTFSRLVWKELGDDGSQKVTVIPRWVGLLFSLLSEIWAKVTGTHTEIDRFIVRFVTSWQLYNIDKARELLGYVPPVTLEEGVRRGAQWWKQSRPEKDRPI